MPSDQKLMRLLPPMKKCPKDFYQGVVFTAQILITVAPVTRDK